VEKWLENRPGAQDHRRFSSLHRILCRIEHLICFQQFDADFATVENTRRSGPMADAGTFPQDLGRGGERRAQALENAASARPGAAFSSRRAPSCGPAALWRCVV
jgi:hypothetical protein